MKVSVVRKILFIIILFISTLNISNSYARYCVISGGICIFPESQQEQEDDTDYYLLIAGGLLALIMFSEMSSTSNFTSDSEVEEFNYNPFLGINFSIDENTNLNLLRWGPDKLNNNPENNMNLNEYMDNVNLFEINYSFNAN